MSLFATCHAICPKRNTNDGITFYLDKNTFLL